MAQISDPNRNTLPGTYPPEWLPDHDANSCISCDSVFTLIRRRHHCRSCGKIFCSDCCRLRAKLLYLGNKEGRVCNNCYYILETASLSINPESTADHEPISNTTFDDSHNASTSSNHRVQGVLKITDPAYIVTNRDDDTTCPDNQLVNKQVMFSDGIRPGTDLSESYGFANIPCTSNDNSSCVPHSSILTRQYKHADSRYSSSSGRKVKNSDSFGHVIFCDDLGYLPPMIVSKCLLRLNGNGIKFSELKLKQVADDSRTAQTSTQPSSDHWSPYYIMIFDELCKSIDVDSILTFVLLKDFYLKVKVVRVSSEQQKNTIKTDDQGTLDKSPEEKEYWCFASDGLSRLGQNEIVFLLDRDVGQTTIPRDVFKIYLTIHELALRRQSLDSLGNLLFQDGLFGERDTAGLLLVRHMTCHITQDYILPDKPYLFALILQRWEVPWSKVFPVRLLLRLGHKSGQYPYPLVSYRSRAPVYYEVGHTIISILGDFRNFRYSITHVDGLKVIINKSEKRVLVQLNETCYQQFNKVLDSASNEHVLAWSSYPFDEADGHLVADQNDDGNYSTIEFYKPRLREVISFENFDQTGILGASFVIFSGALKANQSSRSAKISIVEDGLLIQLQSCTMSALKQAIHSMNQFDIDCGKYMNLRVHIHISYDYHGLTILIILSSCLQHRKWSRHFEQSQHLLASQG